MWVWQWWRMPLILALRRQRQAILCEFKAGLDYSVSSRLARVIQRNPVSKTPLPKEHRNQQVCITVTTQSIMKEKCKKKWQCVTGTQDTAITQE